MVDLGRIGPCLFRHIFGLRILRVGGLFAYRSRTAMLFWFVGKVICLSSMGCIKVMMFQSGRTSVRVFVANDYS